MEDVFMAYRYGSLEDVKLKLDKLHGVPKQGIEGVRKFLALLACQDRRPDVLKFCLDQGGFPTEATMEDEVESVEKTKDPETFKVLEESQQFCKSFAEAEQRKQRVGKFERRAQEGSIQWRGAPPGTEAVFDRGGRLPVDW